MQKKSTLDDTSNAHMAKWRIQCEDTPTRGTGAQDTRVENVADEILLQDDFSNALWHSYKKSSPSPHSLTDQWQERRWMVNQYP